MAFVGCLLWLQLSYKFFSKFHEWRILNVRIFKTLTSLKLINLHCTWLYIRRKTHVHRQSFLFSTCQVISCFCREILPCFLLFLFCLLVSFEWIDSKSNYVYSFYNTNTLFGINCPNSSQMSLVLHQARGRRRCTFFYSITMHICTHAFSSSFTASC